MATGFVVKWIIVEHDWKYFYLDLTVYVTSFTDKKSHNKCTPSYPADQVKGHRALSEEREEAGLVPV